MRQLFVRTFEGLKERLHPSVQGVPRHHIRHLATMSLQEAGPLRFCERREVARAIESRLDESHLGGVAS